MVLSAVLDPDFKPLKFIDESKMDAVKVEVMKRIKVLPPAQQCSDQPRLTAAKMLKLHWISYWVRRRVRWFVGPLDPSQEIDQYLSEKPI